MGHVRVCLDHADYSRLDAAMTSRGYAITITGGPEDDPQELRLPPGSYYRPEPSDAHQMRIDATAAVTDLGELGWSIVATAGVTAWDGLLP